MHICNEDDTFRTLGRVSFTEMCDLWRSNNLFQTPDSFFKYHGWSRSEFWDEFYKQDTPPPYK